VKLEDQRRDRREKAALLIAAVLVFALAVLYGWNSAFPPPLTGGDQATLTPQ